MKPEYSIVFFDGYCNLCNSSVDFIIRRDKKKKYRFGPLQGETAKKYLPETLTKDTHTLVLYKAGTIATTSTAVLEIARDLGWPWRFFFLFQFLPIELRDWIYKGISKNRYRWFGRRDTCRLPTAEEAKRFLP